MLCITEEDILCACHVNFSIDKPHFRGCAMDPEN